MTTHTSPTDPRETLSDDVLDQANRRASPNLVTASGISPGMALGFVGIGLLGVLTFTTLTNGRTDAATPYPTSAVAAKSGQPVAIIPVGPPSPKPVLITAPPPVNSVMGMPQATGPSQAMLAAEARLKAPALVIDLNKPLNAAAAADGKPGMKPGDGISANEQFADRIADAESRPARATRLANGADTVPQGAVVAAVIASMF